MFYHWQSIWNRCIVMLYIHVIHTSCTYMNFVRCARSILEEKRKLSFMTKFNQRIHFRLGGKLFVWENAFDGGYFPFFFAVIEKAEEGEKSRVDRATMYDAENTFATESRWKLFKFDFARSDLDLSFYVSAPESTYINANVHICYIDRIGWFYGLHGEFSLHTRGAWAQDLLDPHTCFYIQFSNKIYVCNNVQTDRCSFCGRKFATGKYDAPTRADELTTHRYTYYILYIFFSLPISSFENKRKPGGEVMIRPFLAAAHLSVTCQIYNLTLSQQPWTDIWLSDIHANV